MQWHSVAYEIADGASQMMRCNLSLIITMAINFLNSSNHMNVGALGILEQSACKINQSVGRVSTED